MRLSVLKWKELVERGGDEVDNVFWSFRVGPPVTWVTGGGVMVRLDSLKDEGWYGSRT